MSVAVVTGAAGGIGAGLAREAAKRGHAVVLADRDEAGLKEVAATIDGDVLIVPTNVADDASVAALAEATYQRHEHVDLLFNNAGILVTGNSWEIPAERWQATLDVNIGGIVNGLRHFVPRMLAADRPARIVNTASIGGFLPAPLMAPYTASKFAVVALTESLAGELMALDSKISVSLLAPGAVDTGIFREAPTAASKDFHKLMVEMTSVHGISGDELAQRAFAAIDRGEYWIITQPESFDDVFAARNQLITNREAPKPLLL